MMRAGPAGAALLLLVTVAACTDPSASSVDHRGGPSRTRSDSITATPVSEPTPTPLATDGSIYFAAESSAGETLTGSRGFGEVETDPQQMDIYVSRTGQPVHRIIATRAHERCPAVSPDGTRLAYLEGPTVVIVPLDADGNPGTGDLRVHLKAKGLYRPDGYRPRNSAGPACPQWSPDGRRLGYLVVIGDPNGKHALFDPARAEVHAVTLDGRDRVLTAFDAVDWDSPHFAWSPDSDSLAYTTVAGVWRARLDGRTPRLMWRAPRGERTQHLPMDDDRPISLAWSSQDELAFTVRSFTPTEPDNPMSGGHETWQVFVVDADSGRTLLKTNAGSVYEAGAGESWSPDGSLLVFSGPDGRIRLNHRATGTTDRVRPTVGGGGGRLEGASWSPDGQKLLARARDDAQGFALVSFDVDGSSSEVRTPWSWTLDWAGLDDVDWSSR